MSINNILKKITMGAFLFSAGVSLPLRGEDAVTINSSITKNYALFHTQALVLSTTPLVGPNKKMYGFAKKLEGQVVEGSLLGPLFQSNNKLDLPVSFSGFDRTDSRTDSGVLKSNLQSVSDGVQLFFITSVKTDSTIASQLDKFHHEYKGTLGKLTLQKVYAVYQQENGLMYAQIYTNNPNIIATFVWNPNKVSDPYAVLQTKGAQLQELKPKMEIYSQPEKEEDPDTLMMTFVHEGSRLEDMQKASSLLLKRINNLMQAREKKADAFMASPEYQTLNNKLKDDIKNIEGRKLGDLVDGVQEDDFRIRGMAALAQVQGEKDHLKTLMLSMGVTGRLYGLSIKSFPKQAFDEFSTAEGVKELKKFFERVNSFDVKVGKAMDMKVEKESDGSDILRIRFLVEGYPFLLSIPRPVMKDGSGKLSLKKAESAGANQPSESPYGSNPQPYQ